MPAGFFNNGSLTNKLVAADNIDFSGSPNPSPSMTTDGQLLIGHTSATSPNILVGTLVSLSSSITIGYSSPNITIQASSGPGTFSWSDVSGTVTASPFHGYFVTGACTSNLPVAPSQGDTISYVVDTASTLTIKASGTQLIRIGSVISIAGGTCANTARGDSITLVYRASDLTWFSVGGPQGNWNVQTS